MAVLKRIGQCFGFEPDIPPLLRMGGTYRERERIPKWFIAMRCIVFILIWYITIFSFSWWSYHGLKYTKAWFLYLTHWSQLLCTLTVTIRLVSTISIWHSSRNSTEHLNDQTILPRYRLLYPLQSVLSEMALPVVSLVTIIYWGLEFSGSFPSVIRAMNSLQTHVLNTIVMWVDYIYSADSLKYKSAIWAIAFGTVYQIWIIIFEIAGWKNANGETFIYTASNWSEGWKVPLVVYFISCILLLLISWLATFIKHSMYKRQEKHSKTVEILTTP